MFLVKIKLELKYPGRFLKDLIFQRELSIFFAKSYGFSLLFRVLHHKMLKLQWKIRIDKT